MIPIVLPLRQKSRVHDIFHPALTLVGLESVTKGLLGAHLVRKFSSTWVQSNVMSNDDKDH